MHRAQKVMADAIKQTADFANHVWSNFDDFEILLDCIINMDKTLLPFEFKAKNTIDKIGKKTIIAEKVQNTRIGCTCCLVVTLNSKKLKLMIIFEESSTSCLVRIVNKPGTKDCCNLHCFYRIQNSHYMDEEQILVWIKNI